MIVSFLTILPENDVSVRLYCTASAV